MVASTRTALDGGAEWIIDDEPVRLRLWGTNQTFDLPKPVPGGEWTIGAASACWLPLQDAGRFVSRRHARLTRNRDRWQLEDLGSKNGTWEDSARRETITLFPGLEIGIGAYRFVTESSRSVALRALLARMLGWDPALGRVVDRSLRALRETATLRMPLSLSGDGDLVAVARRLHRAILGTSKRFVVADPRRLSSDHSSRGPENYASGVEALDAANGGTLCIWAKRPPKDFDDVLARIDDPDSHVRLVLCARLAGDSRMASIRLPPLATRAADIDRIVAEYASDAIELLRAQPSSFTERDHHWIVSRRPRSVSEIERATLRLVAIREYGGVTKAAPRLGLTPSALSRWVGRRVLPR